MVRELTVSRVFPFTAFGGKTRRGFPSARTVTEEERAALGEYAPSADDWAACDAQRALTAIQFMCDQSRFESFIGAVPLEIYPAYATVIPYCIDLDTIRQRLQNRFYRRLSAVECDVEYLLRNALTFNEPTSSVAREARVLCETLLVLMR